MTTILINPKAGKGITSHEITYIEQEYIKRGLNYRIEYSKYIGHITELVIEYGMSSPKLVIVGGDGTLQEAIEGLVKIHWPCELSIIPLGTGNDFARSMGLPLDIEEAIKVAIEGSSMNCFLGICNEHYFSNVVSTGIDAQIVLTRNKLKSVIKGAVSYLISTILMLLIYKPRRYRIKLDHVTIEGEYYLVAAGNGSFYGGGMMITPKGSPLQDDLQIIIIKKVNRFILLYLLPTIYSGKHVNTPHVLQYTSRTCEVDCLDGTQLVNLDGELTKETNVKICKDDGKTAKLTMSRIPQQQKKRI